MDWRSAIRLRHVTIRWLALLSIVPLIACGGPTPARPLDTAIRRSPTPSPTSSPSPTGAEPTPTHLPPPVTRAVPTPTQTSSATPAPLTATPIPPAATQAPTYDLVLVGATLIDGSGSPPLPDAVVALRA